MRHVYYPGNFIIWEGTDETRGKDGKKSRREREGCVPQPRAVNLSSIKSRSVLLFLYTNARQVHLTKMKGGIKSWQKQHSWRCHDEKEALTLLTARLSRPPTMSGANMTDIISPLTALNLSTLYAFLVTCHMTLVTRAPTFLKAGLTHTWL